MVMGMNYKFTYAIEKAIEDCKSFGNGIIKVEVLDREKTVIFAEWSDYSTDEAYEVIEITIVQNGKPQFSYQIEETKALHA